MIKIIAQFFIKSKHIDEAILLGKNLSIETRKEYGCIGYEFYQNDEDKNHLVFTEKWESEYHLMQHLVTPHFTNFVIKIDKLKSKERIIESFNTII
ncbi:MAG: putative quinol monooxygenase [Clostridia bacterium]